MLMSCSSDWTVANLEDRSCSKVYNSVMGVGERDEDQGTAWSACTAHAPASADANAACTNEASTRERSGMTRVLLRQ